MKQSKKMRMIKALILISVLLALSGMVVTVSADDLPLIPNQFYGTVTINGADAPAGTTITAYIDGDPRESIEVTTAGEYGSDLNYLEVTGSEVDIGKTITFTVSGSDETETAVWGQFEVPRKLDIGEPPVGTTSADTQGSSSGGTSSSGGAAGGTGEISRPGPLPTVTPNGATSAPDEGATPASAEAHTPAASTSADDKSGSGGPIPGFEAMFAITGMLAIAYLVRRSRR